MKDTDFSTETTSLQRTHEPGATKGERVLDGDMGNEHTRVDRYAECVSATMICADAGTMRTGSRTRTFALDAQRVLGATAPALTGINCLNRPQFCAVATTTRTGS